MIGVILSVFLTAAASTRAQSIQCPDIPLDVPGQPVDVTKAAGIWYEYMYRNGPVGNDPSGVNVFMNATILGPTPGTPPGSSYFVTWIYNMFANIPGAADPLMCINFPQQGNYSSNGHRTVLAQIGGPTAPLENYTYINLYTDYNLVQLLYRCETANRDGRRCDQPFFWIITRIRPPLLTSEQKRYMENLANYYFAQICRRFSDLSPTTWDLTTNFPVCNTGANNTPPLSAIFLASLPRN